MSLVYFLKLVEVSVAVEGNLGRRVREEVRIIDCVFGIVFVVVWFIRFFTCD